MSEVIECLQCGETQAAIRAHQSRGEPFFCATVDYYGDCSEEWERHRFRDYTDKELHFILPEFRHLYRRAFPGWGTPCEHTGKKCEVASMEQAKVMGFSKPRCGRCLAKLEAADVNEN